MTMRIMSILLFGGRRILILSACDKVRYIYRLFCRYVVDSKVLKVITAEIAPNLPIKVTIATFWTAYTA